jgi:hypothetical protein
MNGMVGHKFTATAGNVPSKHAAKTPSRHPQASALEVRLILNLGKFMKRKPCNDVRV